MKQFKSTIIKTFICPLLLIFSSEVFAHGGRLNKEGCHNDTKTASYHCHKSSSQTKNKNTASKKSVIQNENYYNSALAKYFDGELEARLNYRTSSGLNGYVKVDILTDKLVIEGGLDKRSSLDSLQQAIFASTLVDRDPAIALYDTDGVIGKYEHRIITAAKKAGVRVFWVSKGTITEK